MFDPQRIMDVKWAFSAKKQADYATLVPDDSITLAVPVIGTEIFELSRVQYTDEMRYGKGHEFATTQRELTRDSKYARTMDLSSLAAGWVCAFGMGKVVTTQPNPGGNPTAYKHVFTFFDPATAGKQVPVTTIVEKVSSAANFLRRLESMAISDFTISGKNREVCQVAVNLMGSGKVTTGADASFPASLSAVSLLDMGVMTFKLGTQGAPTDLSVRLLDFTLKVTQNLDAANGYAPGSGIYRDRMWVGNREVALDATVWMDSANSDMLDHWNSNDILEIQLNLDGDLILAGQPEKHSCDIILPAAKMTANQIGVSGDKLIYKISVAKGDVYKGAGGTPDEPLQITVQNTIAAWLGT